MVIIKKKDGATIRMLESAVMKRISEAITEHVKTDTNGSANAFADRYRIDANTVKRVMAETIGLDELTVKEYRALTKAAGFLGDITFEER